LGGEATVRIAVLQNLIINGAHLAVEHVRHLTDLLQLMHRIGARRADLQICVFKKVKTRLFNRYLFSIFCVVAIAVILVTLLIFTI